VRDCDVCGIPAPEDSCRGYTIKAEPGALRRYADNRHIKAFPCQLWLLTVCRGHSDDEILRSGFVPFDMIDKMGNLRNVLNQWRVENAREDEPKAA
jgi:hypothetical protein